MPLFDEKQGVLPPMRPCQQERELDFALTEILDSKTNLGEEQNFS